MQNSECGLGNNKGDSGVVTRDSLFGDIEVRNVEFGLRNVKSGSGLWSRGSGFVIRGTKIF